MNETELGRYAIAHSTDHYVFHCLPGSKAAEDLERIAAYQEKWFGRIADVLGVMPDFHIRYFLTNTAEDAGRIYGDDEPCNGFAYEPDIIVATYNDRVTCLGPHEDTHVISWLLAKPPSAFLREGLAMYMDASWLGKANTWWCKQFLKEGCYIPIADLLENECFYSAPCEVTYPIAGVFTRYGVETLGREIFLRSVYRYPGPVKDALEGAFEQSLAATEKDFLVWLGALDLEEQYTAPIVF